MGVPFSWGRVGLFGGFVSQYWPTQMFCLSVNLLTTLTSPDREESSTDRVERCELDTLRCDSGPSIETPSRRTEGSLPREYLTKKRSPHVIHTGTAAVNRMSYRSLWKESGAHFFSPPPRAIKF